MQETTTSDVLKQKFRQYLLYTDRWMLDKRSKKYETYKKRINSVEYRIRFIDTESLIILDAGIKNTNQRLQWRRLHESRYEYLNTNHDIMSFLRILPPIYKETEEDKENMVYLERMGAV